MSNRNWLIIAVSAVVLVFLCACCALAAFLIPNIRTSVLSGVGYVEVSDTLSQSLTVGTPATLIVDGSVGEIQVRVGNSNDIVIDAIKVARSRNQANAEDLLRRISVDISATPIQANIVIDTPNTTGGDQASVRLTITVPRRTDVDIQNSVGDIHLDGTEGAVHVRADVGAVDIRNVTLMGNSEARSSVGDVRFAGSVPAEGELQAVSGIGAVTVELPRGSSFLLDAQTNLGKINSGFDLQDSKTSPPGISATLTGYAGDNPAARLTLRADTGSIDIRSQ